MNRAARQIGFGLSHVVEWNEILVAFGRGEKIFKLYMFLTNINQFQLCCTHSCLGSLLEE